jgi:hypothetical protein
MADSGAKRSVWQRSRRCADGACVEVKQGEDGRVQVRSSVRPDTTLHLSAAQWAAFLAGVTRGDFD